MEDLLKPDFGVLALTVCNFLLLVYLLKKFAWGPVIGALEKRETQIASDKQTAATARKEAEQLKQELDSRLAEISKEAAQKMAEAVKIGEAQKEQLLSDAKAQTEKMLEQTRQQLEAEKNKALAQVRGEIASISVLAASRIIEQQVKDNKLAGQIVEQVLTDIKGK